MCATSTMSLHPTPPTHPTQPTWQAWRKMHLSHRLQWAKHVPKRVVTYDWSQKQIMNKKETCSSEQNTHKTHIKSFLSETNRQNHSTKTVSNACTKEGFAIKGNSSNWLVDSLVFVPGMALWKIGAFRILVAFVKKGADTKSCYFFSGFFCRKFVGLECSK